MHICRWSIVCCLCATLCHAQATKTDQALLSQVREKYDAPFDRNLQSFNCAVDFNWKQHWTETTRVGDEGTDEQIEKLIQPIRNRVEVTQQKVSASSGLTDEEMNKLPYEGMAEGLLEHAVEKSLYTWLMGSTRAILGNPATLVSIEQSPSGYKLTFKVQDSEIELVLAPDMRLQRGGMKANPADRIETLFESGQHGFHLTSMTMGENGNFVPGNRLIYTYTYQTVGGVELPEHVVVIRESHHEVWRYTLSGCSAKTGK